MTNHSATKGLELPAVLIAPNRDLASAFTAACEAARAFRVAGEWTDYPTQQAIEQQLTETGAPVVLVDLETSTDAGHDIIRFLCSARPETHVIGLHSQKDAQLILSTLRLGARDFFCAPFDPAIQRDSARKLWRLQSTSVTTESDEGRMVVFSSIKPGSGASTLALHSAFALKRVTGRRVLLVDLNLVGGTIGASLKLSRPVSIIDALRQFEGMDPVRWSALTAVCGGVDVLPAPERPHEEGVDVNRLRRVLEYARLVYDWVIVDLPVIFSRSSQQVLAESYRAFLVSTSELPSLHLGRKAVHLLSLLGFGREHFHMLLNRVSAREGLRPAEMEKIFECPVHAVFPNDYFSLHRATAVGKPLDFNCELGQAIESLVRRLAGLHVENTARAGARLQVAAALAGA